MGRAAPNTVREMRRGQILDAARTLVATAGLDALTIGRLEGVLSFSRGVITYHFKNKDEIVRAVLDEAVAEIDAAVDDVAASAELGPARVAAVVRGMTEGFLARDEARQVLVAFWSRMANDEVAKEKNAALFAGWRKRSARLIRAGQRAGTINDDVDANAMAAHLVGIVIGVVTQVSFQGRGLKAGAVLDEAIAALDLRLRPR